MTAEKFLEQYEAVMLEEEIEELKSGKFENVYYAGQIQQRTQYDL